MLPTDLVEITSIIFAPPGLKKTGVELQNDIEAALEHEKIVICETISSLAYFLLPQRSNKASKQIVIVLFIKNTTDMRDVMEFHDLLTQFSLIIILNDNYGGLVNIANKMNPCFITFAQDLGKDNELITQEFIKLRDII